MKRIVIGTLTSLALIGCSKSASVNVVLNSNDSAAAALRSGAANLTTGATTADGGSDADLTTVKSVTVTINEIDAHVVDKGDKEAKELDDKTGEVDGTQVDDHDSKWQVISSTPKTIDLMTIRDGISQSLGIAQLPDGKITQIRLKLKTDSTVADGKDVISGAVIDSSGATCDLFVPHSATDPGVKIEGVFKAKALTGGDQHLLEVNVKLKESQKDTSTAGCAYFLNPVIEIEKFEDEGPEHDGDSTDAEHSDGGSDSEHTDGGI